MEYHIFSDFWGGNINQAYDRIEELKKQNQIKGDIYDAFFTILHGDLTTVRSLIAPIINREYGELPPFENLMLKIVQSRVLLREYKGFEATKVIDGVLKQIEENPLPEDRAGMVWAATAYGVRAFCALAEGKYSDGINYMKKAIAIGEKADLPYILTKLYNDMGNMYCEIGDLEKGISSIHKSIAIALTTEKPYLCCQYGTLSEIHLRKGELDEALKYGEQALQVVEERCTLWAVACYHEVLGRVYFKAGNNERAAELITKAKKIRMDTEMYHSVGYDLKDLALIELSQNNIDGAKFQYEQLKELYNQTRSERIAYFCEFTDALLTMQGKRVRNLARSQAIFKKLLTIQNLSAYEKIDIYLNLCSLLILELKIAEDDEVINELHGLTDEMYQIADNLKSNSLLAEILAIKAQIWLIRGNIEKALEKVDEARSVVQNLGQARLEERIVHIKNEIQENYMEWKNIVAANSSFGTKIEKSMIENYIADSIKVRNDYEYFPS
ncbi:MAG: tetratricopeptide repeat protein [Candidatus Thorarchaeota archaeon]